MFLISCCGPNREHSNILQNPSSALINKCLVTAVKRTEKYCSRFSGSDSNPHCQSLLNKAANFFLNLSTSPLKFEVLLRKYRKKPYPGLRKKLVSACHKRKILCRISYLIDGLRFRSPGSVSLSAPHLVYDK